MFEIKLECGCIEVDCAGMVTIERINPKCVFHNKINMMRNVNCQKSFGRFIDEIKI